MRLSDLVPAIAILTTLFGCDRSSSAGQGTPVQVVRYVAVDQDDNVREYRVRVSFEPTLNSSGFSVYMLEIGNATRPIKEFWETASADSTKRVVIRNRCFFFDAENWSCQEGFSSTFSLLVDGDTLYTFTGKFEQRRAVRKYVRD